MKRLLNKKAFTIMEMLIVVAIIAVLVAIAIPTFNGALTKSKEATDVANLRANYAEQTVKYLTGNSDDFPATGADLEGTLEANLNYGDNVTVDPQTKADSYTITYEAEKLTNKDGGNEFTWTLSKYDIQ